MEKFVFYAVLSPLSSNSVATSSSSKRSVFSNASNNVEGLSIDSPELNNFPKLNYFPKSKKR